MIDDYEGCLACPLAERPAVRGFGPQPARMMIIGEAPGRTEAREGRPFIGLSGQLLRSSLKLVGVDPDSCRITNTVICHPDGNETPKKDSIDACRDRLLAEIEVTQPDRILLLGATSLSVLGWKSIVRSRGLGTILTVGGREIFVVATYHPAAILRSPDLFRDFIHDLSKLVSANRPIEHILPAILPLPTTVEEVAEYLSIFRDASVVSCDTETTGVDPLTDVIQAIGFGALTGDDGEGIALVIPYDLVEASKPVVVDFIRTFEGTLVFHNIKFDMSFFRHWSRDEFLTPLDPMDTLMMVYASDERGSSNEGSGMAYFTAGLKDQARLRYDIPDYHFDFETFQSYSDDAKPWWELYVYLALDCIITAKLYFDLYRDLEGESEKLIDLVRNLLVPGALAFSLVELRGFQIDPVYLQELDVTVSEEVEKLRDELRRRGTEHGLPDFNPASPKQVRVIAAAFNFHPPSFEKEPLQVEIETGKMSDDCREFFEVLLEYRQKSKVLQTYIHGIKKRLDPKGRIHPDFLLHGTDTGRLSCRNPNLQNIPSIMGPMIKRAFSAPEGWVVMNADYSQLELRVAAFYSRDEAMIRAYREGQDLHRWVASLMFKKPMSEISSFERYLAKYLDFGLLYGRQARGLMEGMEAVYILKTTGKAMTVQEADSLQKAFFDAFPGLKRFITDQHRRVREDQFVETPTGRRRRFPYLDKYTRSGAERKGVNTPVQSLASDMTLTSVIRISKELDPRDGFIVSSVHDSIMLQVREAVVDQVAEIVRRIMETPVIPEFDIPIKVDIGWAKNWGDIDK